MAKPMALHQARALFPGVPGSRLYEAVAGYLAIGERHNVYGVSLDPHRRGTAATMVNGHHRLGYAAPASLDEIVTVQGLRDVEQAARRVGGRTAAVLAGLVPEQARTQCR